MVLQREVFQREVFRSRREVPLKVLSQLVLVDGLLLGLLAHQLALGEERRSRSCQCRRGVEV